ncbi:sulfur carrier protein ThiS adenylyltransferase ThiF [uncultured Clostridium sp.]|uniref:sulfur carrier protein ThiS adenylyltransferase ThiF n=1 Tax=uncultured Clostridium sp. TaxID=59620 RepID=UPI0025EF8330|nr:sulfur carrier protein ThiS adenylyltransferase ThiF [uncultured Clostridium sp.]
MRVKVNEKLIEVEEGSTIYCIRDLMVPNCDVTILNGFPIKEDKQLKNGDTLVFIKKGEMPPKDELETLMMSRHTPGVFNKLKNGVVGVAGLGGLGSNIAIALARVGIGKLVLVDFDVVEPSNLNRQQYYIRHIGMKKTEAIKEQLAEINPFIIVETIDKYLDENNVTEIFSSCEVIIEAFDNPKCKADLVNTILLKTKEKKIIGNSGMAGLFTSNSIKTRKINSRFYLCGDGENEAKEGSGLMAPRVQIVAGHAANMAVRLLLGNEEIENER